MNWFYQIMGEQVGPLSGTELKQLARRGTIGMDTLVRKEDGSWVQASRVRGLFSSDVSTAQSTKLPPSSTPPLPPSEAKPQRPTKMWLIVGIPVVIICCVTLGIAIGFRGQPPKEVVREIRPEKVRPKEVQTSNKQVRQTVKSDNVPVVQTPEYRPAQEYTPQYAPAKVEEEPYEEPKDIPYFIGKLRKYETGAQRENARECISILRNYDERYSDLIKKSFDLQRQTRYAVARQTEFEKQNRDILDRIDKKKKTDTQEEIQIAEEYISIMKTVRDAHLENAKALKDSNRRTTLDWATSSGREFSRLEQAAKRHESGKATAIDYWFLAGVAYTEEKQKEFEDKARELEEIGR
jgi:hypothetical protein